MRVYHELPQTPLAGTKVKSRADIPAFVVVEPLRRQQAEAPSIQSLVPLRLCYLRAGVWLSISYKTGCQLAPLRKKATAMYWAIRPGEIASLGDK